MNIYLVYNNYVVSNLSYEDNDLYGISREKRPLSIEGENVSNKMSKLVFLKNIEKIYSSTYSSSIGTAKYLSDTLNIPINVTKLINERKIGYLNDDLKEFIEMQEHNHNYKLSNGESINDVKNRALLFLKQVMKIDNNKDIIIYSHDTFLKALLINYCKVGYNLNNRMILEYNHKTIMDEQGDKFKMYKLVVEDNYIKDIEVIL